MLDLHCHFLPGVDDGPTTMDEALAMARAAVADGIRLSVLTPHIDPQRYANKRTSLRRAAAEFAARLKAEDIPLQLRLGGEAMVSAELPELIAAGEVPFLGEVDGYRILLLEFPHSIIPIGSDKLVTTLLRQRVRPLIAHPERNAAIIDSPDRLRPFVELGCWVQLTSDSVTGRFGPAIEQTAWRLLDAGWNCLLATDAHNIARRPPCLSSGRDALRRRYGEAFAQDHVRTKPARIVGVTITARAS